jgi:VanZ family protein
MRTLLSHHLPAIGWAVLTAVLLVAPGDSLPEMGGWLPPWLEQVADKLVHALLFFVLGVLVFRCFQGLRDARRRVVLTAALCLAYAAVLELAQMWIPQRSWDPMDLVAGGLGAMLALAVTARRG